MPDNNFLYNGSPKVAASAASAAWLATYNIYEGGVSSIVWSVFSGALPPGVTLGAGNGNFTGTYTAAGHYTAIIKMTWVGGSNGTMYATAEWYIDTAPGGAGHGGPGGSRRVILTMSKYRKKP